LFLECCGYEITPTARPGGSMQINADHTPQGAWAPVASPDEVEASVVLLFSALIIGLLPVQLFA